MAIGPATLREAGELRMHLRERLVASATHMPPALYHYTDATGLLGIVRSGTVWATHYAYLNDASEFKYAIGVMRDVVTQATADADPDTWKGRFRQVITQDNDSSFYDSDWAQDPDEQQFLACFSEVGDGLSQWRGYGKSIGGYSLGFHFSDLHGIETRVGDSQDGKEFRRANPKISAEFLPCTYDRGEQIALITDGFERALRYCETARHPVDDNSLKALLGAILRSVSSSFKDPAFADEREWRLVVRIWSPSFGSVRAGHLRERTEEGVQIDQMATVHFRSGEFSLVPYVVVPVAHDPVLSLSHVVVGPTPLPDNARAAAMQLLLPAGEGLPATARRRVVCNQVTSSSIPFRRV